MKKILIFILGLVSFCNCSSSAKQIDKQGDETVETSETSGTSGTTETSGTVETAQKDYGFESDVFKTKKGRKVAIHFIKHGTLMMDVDGYTIHIDPVTMFGTDYSKLPKADLLLVTHEHKDHFDMDAIGAVTKDGNRFLSNGRVAEMSKKSEAMQIGQTIDLGNNITITATAAYNNSPGKENFHPKGRDVGFVITVDNLKIYVAGDTEDIEEMKQLKNIDVAFLPVNQPFTMTPEQCIKAVEMFRPKVVYPYHYGQTDLTPIVEHFKSNKKIDVRVRQLQ